MAETRVVNKVRESFDVYIGRPSKWGNPFLIGKDGSREMVIKSYKQWVNHPEQVQLRADIKVELKGKRLGCYCKPKACHGDVLAEIADE